MLLDRVKKLVKKDDPVRKTAKEVRKWAETMRHVPRNNAASFPAGLNGMCAITSVELTKRLKRQKIENVRLAYNDGHVFVLVGDKLVDVTATQFGVSSKVTIKQLSDVAADNWWWNVHEEFTSVASLQKYIKTVGWPSYQQPSCFYKEIKSGQRRI